MCLIPMSEQAGRQAGVEKHHSSHGERENCEETARVDITMLIMHSIDHMAGSL